MEWRRLLSILLICVAIQRAQTFNFFRDRIPNGHNVQHPCKPNTVWNGVGHLSQQGGGPRNAFGLDFFEAGKTWTRDLCMKDSDGDGQTNGQELGDPQCAWTQGGTPSRTTAITHPGFKTPASSYPYNETDLTILDCSGQYDCPGRDLPDTKVLNLRMAPGTRVPAKTTTYYCTTFEVPSDQIYHGISFEPILDNLNVIHHMLIFGCSEDAARDIGKPGECGMSSATCREMLGGWTLGLHGTCSPPEAGFRFGKGTFRHFQMQVHWNNPEHTSTYTDTSGMKVHYTPKLRQNDLGLILLGQRNLKIPANTPSTTATSTCAPTCTNHLLSTGTVFVTRSIIHMHLLGKQGTIDLTDGNNVTTRILNEPVYDYNTPKWTDHRPYIKLNRDATLRTTCTFDSSGKNKTTYYGDGTDDEMCFGYLQYFPKRGDIHCTQYGTKDFCFSDSTVCGPTCDFAYYLDTISPVVSRALADCPTSSAVTCTDACANDLQLINKVYYDKCLTLRHPKAYSNFLRAFKGQSIAPMYTACKKQGKLPRVLPSIPPFNRSENAEPSHICPSRGAFRPTGTPSTQFGSGSGASSLSLASLALSASMLIITVMLS